MLSFIRAMPRSLVALYLAVLALRTGSYMATAIVVSVTYLPSLSTEQLAIMFSLYPIAELVAVMPFGTICDRVGRKVVLLASHVIMSVCIAGFILAAGNVLAAGALMLAQGVGAAALISSSLAMVADHSSNDNRARMMAIYDFLALGGLAGGFLVATILALKFGASDPGIDAKILLLANIVVVFSLVVTLTLVRETRISQVLMRTSAMIKAVLGRREVLRLLPVYIPVIAIYGMVLAFTRNLIHEHDIGLERDPLIVAAVIGVGLMGSMLMFGHFSDRLRRRKPFIAAGLICFGTLAGVLLLFAKDLSFLAARWPLVLALAVGSGAFPPAILGYLSDISKHETRGTTFGVYSLIFGTGMVIGPILGSFARTSYGELGLVGVMAGLVAIGSLSTLRLREYALETKDDPPSTSISS